jgi:hypothetical protein
VDDGGSENSEVVLVAALVVRVVAAAVQTAVVDIVQMGESVGVDTYYRMGSDEALRMEEASKSEQEKDH